MHDAGHMAPRFRFRNPWAPGMEGFRRRAADSNFVPPSSRRSKLLIHGRAGLESVVADALYGDRLDGGDVQVDLLVEVRGPGGTALEPGNFGGWATGGAAAILIDQRNVFDVGRQPAQRAMNQRLARLHRIEVSFAGDTGGRKCLEIRGHLVASSDSDRRREKCGQNYGKKRDSTHGTLHGAGLACPDNEDANSGRAPAEVNLLSCATARASQIFQRDEVVVSVDTDLLGE